MQTKFADVWGHKVRYLEEGKSGKTILLIHGLGGSAERWLKVIPILSPKYRVIAPDMIGFGYSDKPSVDYTIEFFGKFLSAFIDTLGLKTAILVGTSLGGQIAAECTNTNHAIEKLVLVSPSGAMKQSTAAVDAYMMAALYPNHASARTAFEMMANSGTVDEFTVSDFVKRMSIPNAKLAFISSVLGIKNSKIDESLQKICMFVGKRDSIFSITLVALVCIMSQTEIVDLFSTVSGFVGCGLFCAITCYTMRYLLMICG
ncbi:MAG: alpha/beta hydrolase [Nitrosotalea sp.]